MDGSQRHASTTAPKKPRCRLTCRRRETRRKPRQSRADPLHHRGRLHPDILDAYWRCGFYVFEGVLKADELADIERDVHDILDRLPAERGAVLDAKGRPALAADCKGPNLLWSSRSAIRSAAPISPTAAIR